MSLRNNLISGGEGNAGAHAAELMGTDNAMLPDSSRSKDTHMNPAHFSITSLPVFINSIHDSVNSFAVK